MALTAVWLMCKCQYGEGAPFRVIRPLLSPYVMATMTTTTHSYRRRRGARRPGLGPEAWEKIMKHRSRILLGVAVVTGFVAPVGAFTFSGGPAAAAPPKPLPPAYTCSGGDLQTGKFVPIPPGTYGSLWIKGVCRTAPGTVITVVGSVTVQPHAVFDAQSFASTITVGGDITTGTGSLLAAEGPSALLEPM